MRTKTFEQGLGFAEVSQRILIPCQISFTNQFQQQGQGFDAEGKDNHTMNIHEDLNIGIDAFELIYPFL